MDKVPWKNDELLNWIRTSGYPLEYRLAQTLKSMNQDPILDLQIESLDDKIVREIDVAFDTTCKDTKHKTRFLIECKYTKNPWIALSGFSESWGALELDNYSRTAKAGHFWYNAEDLRLVETHLIESGYFGNASKPCNSLHEPSKNKNDRDDITYKTLKKIVYSAHDFAKLISSLDTDWNFTCIPCIVISNDLYQASWSPQTTDFELKPVSMVRLNWMGTGGRRTVLVSTMANATAFCDTLINMGNCLNYIHRHFNS